MIISLDFRYFLLPVLLCKHCLKYAVIYNTLFKIASFCSTENVSFYIILKVLYINVYIWSLILFNYRVELGLSFILIICFHLNFCCLSTNFQQCKYGYSEHKWCKHPYMWSHGCFILGRDSMLYLWKSNFKNFSDIIKTESSMTALRHFK